MKNTAKSYWAAAMLLGFCSGLSASAAALYPFDVSYVRSNYQASASIGSVPDVSSGLWMANLRGKDTWHDVVIANEANDAITIALGNDKGGFVESSFISFDVGFGPKAVRTGLLNRDAYEDIVVLNTGTNYISILINTNKGIEFEAEEEFVVGETENPSPIDVAFVDLDLDKTNDLLVVNAAENNVSALYQSLGSFDLVTNYTVGLNPQAIVMTDINGDGKKDMVTVNKDDGTVTYRLFNTNTYFFDALQTITLEPGGDPQPVALRAGDLVGDEVKELVTANYNSNTLSVITVETNGTASVYTNLTVGAHPRGVMVRDLNNDGRADLATTCFDDGTVVVYLTTTNGTFAGPFTFAVGAGPVALEGANLNGDNGMDIVVANSGDNTISTLIYDQPLAYDSDASALEDRTNTVTVSRFSFPGRTNTYTVVDSPTNGMLLGSGPAYSYIPAADFFGTDSFSYYFTDGVSTSLVGTVTVNVKPVNDAPSFTLNNNEFNLKVHGVVNTYTNVVASYATGPANEGDQKVTFVFSMTNASFFASKPVLNTNGVLTFRVAAGASGTNTVTVQAKDSSSTASGGANLSPGQSITIIAPPNPYPAIKGSYNGLFQEAGGVAYGKSGGFTYTLKDSGIFTGKLNMERPYYLSGQFDVNGTAQVTVARGIYGGPVTVTLAADISPANTKQVTGTVSDGVWTADLRGDLLVYSASTNPAPQAGRYTMLLPGNPNASASPGGDGYATILVEPSGRVKASGILADGRAFSQTTYISESGDWPFYVSAYSGKGTLLGWLNFTNVTETAIAGNVTWIKTAAVGGAYYNTGFSYETAVIGSTFSLPQFGLTLDATDAYASIDRGNLPGALTNRVTGLSTVQAGGINALKVNFRTTYGNISGSFKYPGVSNASTTYKGVVLQQQRIAGGYFLGPSEGGRFHFEPAN